MENSFEPVIGLEVHIELKTKSKMFCRCPSDHFGKEANTQVCPTCLGLPGALPVPNRGAIDSTVLIGLAFDCSIKQNSKFDRKNYFYPDLPKAYQISQYDLPFAYSGYYGVAQNRIRIKRVHLEEDTAKLQHAQIDGESISLIDFNRSGVPLVEIVTEPDIKSSSQAKEFLQEVQQVIRKLGVSDCDMEKGSMRLEANVSVRKKGDQNLPKFKVEIKNINSFRFLERAINYDVKRQIELLGKGEIPKQETRGYSEAKDATFSQRSKEDAQEYRYFPEPDIPPIRLTQERITEIKSSIPEMPKDTEKRFVAQFNLSSSSAATIAQNPQFLRIFEEAVDINPIEAVGYANIIVNKRFGENLPLNGNELIEFVKKSKSQIVSDENKIKSVALEMVKQYPKAVLDFKSGKESAIFSLIGKMRDQLGQIDVAVAQKVLKEIIDEI